MVVIEDPLGAFVERTYTNGNLTGVVGRRSNATDRTYDQGRLTHLEAADGAVTDFSYDGSGRLETRTVVDGSDEFVTTHGYDGFERVPSSITGPSQDGSPVTYLNVVDGRVEDVTGPDGVVTHDEFNPTTATMGAVAIDPADGSGPDLNLVTASGHDTLGRQTSVEVDPDDRSGPELDISTVTTNDPLTGQVASVTEGESPTTYVYNDDGTLAEVTVPQGTVTSDTYDPGVGSADRDDPGGAVRGGRRGRGAGRTHDHLLLQGVGGDGLGDPTGRKDQSWRPTVAGSTVTHVLGELDPDADHDRGPGRGGP